MKETKEHTANAPEDSHLREDLVTAYLYVQQKCQEEGTIPVDKGNILSRNRGLLEIIGAIHLGLLLAVLSILMSFIVINYLLHLQPS